MELQKLDYLFFIAALVGNNEALGVRREEVCLSLFHEICSRVL